ncbi:MAG: ABC transporter substrate-binding protein [Bacillota bacterium]
MKLESFAAIVSLAAASLWPAHAAEIPKDTPSVEEMAAYRGPDRTAKLLAAAKAEGELDVYHVYPPLTKVVSAFSKKYAIPAKLWRSSSETVLQRLVTEARGGRFDADVVQNNAVENEAACREKLFLEVRSPAQDNLIPQAVPASHCWTGFTIDVFIAAYNTAKVPREDLPATYEDLLKPRWKGAIAVEADDSSWFGALAVAMGEEKAHKLFENLVATNGLAVRKGHSLLTNLVASGEVPIALDTYGWIPEQLKDKSAPIDVVALSPLMAQFSTIAVVKRAKHPYTALLFYDFMLEEGQKVLNDLKFVPASTKFEPAARKLPLTFIDPGIALENRDKWLRDYQNIVVKGAR